MNMSPGFGTTTRPPKFETQSMLRQTSGVLQDMVKASLLLKRCVGKHAIHEIETLEAGRHVSATNENCTSSSSAQEQMDAYCIFVLVFLRHTADSSQVRRFLCASRTLRSRMFGICPRLSRSINTSRVDGMSLQSGAG